MGRNAMRGRLKQFLERTKAVEILIGLMLLTALGLAGYISVEKSRQMDDVVERYVADESSI